MPRVLHEQIRENHSRSDGGSCDFPRRRRRSEGCGEHFRSAKIKVDFVPGVAKTKFLVFDAVRSGDDRCPFLIARSLRRSNVERNCGRGLIILACITVPSVQPDTHASPRVIVPVEEKNTAVICLSVIRSWEASEAREKPERKPGR